MGARTATPESTDVVSTTAKTACQYREQNQSRNQAIDRNRYETAHNPCGTVTNRETNKRRKGGRVIPIPLSFSGLGRSSAKGLTFYVSCTGSTGTFATTGPILASRSRWSSGGQICPSLIPKLISGLIYRTFLKSFNSAFAESADLRLLTKVTGSLASQTAECNELDSWFMCFSLFLDLDFSKAWRESTSLLPPTVSFHGCHRDCPRQFSKHGVRGWNCRALRRIEVDRLF